MSARARFVSAIVAAVAIAAALAPRDASASTKSGSTTVKWYSQALVNVSLTPNYYPGFGAVKAAFGAQPAPTHGPDTALGAVDFGTVLSGAAYLYKYAVHINVTTTSANGFNLYGEGAADFFNQSDGARRFSHRRCTTCPLRTVRPLIPTPVLARDIRCFGPPGAPSSTSFNPAPTISYVTYPAPIASTATANADFYYDYELKVPPTATAGYYFVWVVYTVMAK